MKCHDVRLWAYALMSGCVLSLLLGACRDKAVLAPKLSSSHADSLMERESVMEDSSRFEDGLLLAHQALAIYRQFNDSASISDCNAAILNCSMRLGDFTSAIEAGEECISIDQRRNDPERLSSDYNNMAATYLAAKRTDDARRLIEKAIEMELTLDNPRRLSIRYGMASEVYVKLNRPDEALQMAEKAYSLDKAEGDTVKMGRRLSQMGDAYTAKGDFDRAEKCYGQAIELLAAKRERTSTCITHKQLGQLYMKSHRANEAIASFEKSLDMARQNNQKYIVQTVCESLAQLYTPTNPARALRLMQESSALKDSLYSEKNTQLASSFAARFASAEMEHTIERQQAELAGHRFFFAIISLVLLLLCALIVTLYYLLRARTKARNMLRHINNMRNNFFTNITHELRTPLTVINGLSAQLLRRKDLTKTEQERCAADISRQGQSLLRLVNELLEVTRMSLGQQNCQWMHGNIVAYIGMTVDSYRQYAATKGASIFFNPGQNDIQADFVGEYISKILRNLIGNSMKFMPHNGVVNVGCKLDETGKKQPSVVITVEDNGRGFSDDDLPHIFDMFYQGSRQEYSASTGIGLNYVRQMVEAMHGTISAANNADGGALLTIRLPLSNADAQGKPWDGSISDDEHQETELPDSQLPDDTDSLTTQPTLLIVEDNPDIAFYISTVMGNNFNTLFAANGSEALQKAQEAMPDIILTDIMMPAMDGLDMTRAIRQSEILNHIPVIVITAKTSQNDKLKALQAGADAVLVKPFDPDELTLRVNNLLQQHRLLRLRYAQATPDDSDAYADMKDVEREFINKLNSHISANMANRGLNADMLADLMRMTRTQLTSKTRAVTGITANNYITRMRMSHAKRLLANTDMPVGDIAMKCGFEDMGYFGRVFKQTYHQTPTQFRKGPH